MLINAQRVDVWATDLKDEVGATLEKLRVLVKAGANLQFIIARRRHAKPGTGVLYVAPITGEGQQSAAKEAGFGLVDSMHSVRVEGADEPGVAFKITDALAGVGINLRGISAARIGKQCVFYLAFDTEAHATQAIDVLNRL